MQIVNVIPTIISRVCGATVWALLAVVAVLIAHAGAQAQSIHFEKMSINDCKVEYSLELLLDGDEHLLRFPDLIGLVILHHVYPNE